MSMAKKKAPASGGAETSANENFIIKSITPIYGICQGVERKNMYEISKKFGFMKDLQEAML